ncbi:hypothetical protein CC86DRAFT_99307 [Ophiobolus disseminans]|uniref:Extracellular membrane protein CFEM domain-containing protein n=1 Tax=Ophiobolus disseminans TaxID=1469910 RepID=A0A6A6ZL56_9PLEO|nr:hypothetical protein CC86DRAFT_99307 [Ophiobolus disseminans]
MAATPNSPRSRHSLSTWLIITYLCVIQVAYAQETYTDSACRAATTAMNSCAKRWDSIRQECTKRVSTNTIWPGPCECAYFANDMPCFDEQAICAPQVWTQVPQWFRDGVSSCLMKDAGFTVRANLGSAVGVMGNPFTVKDLPGRATRTTMVVDAGVVTGVARTGAGVSVPSQTVAVEIDEGLSTGAKAGFGVGIGVGVVLVAIVAFLIVRSRRRRAAPAQDTEKRDPSPVELYDDRAHIHQLSSNTIHQKNELHGDSAKRFELGVRASTWLVELPTAHSKRGSRHPN